MKIKQGSVEEIISSSQSEGEFDFALSTGALVVARTKGEAAREHGRRIERGDRGTLTVPSGESVFAKAVDSDADLTLERSGFFLDLLPRTSQKDEKTEYARSGTYESISNEFDVAAGATVDRTMYENETDHSVFLLEFPCAFDGGTANDNSFVQVYIRDYDTNYVKYRSYSNVPSRFTFDPMVELEPGDKVTMEITNHGSATAHYHIAYTVIDPEGSE